MRAPILIPLTAILAGAVVVAGCAGKGGKSKTDEPDPGAVEEPDSRAAEEADPTRPGAQSGQRPEVAPSVSYAGSAEENWKLGEDAFKDEDYLVAQRFYSYIRNKYPYSQFAASAALRIGDCQYERERYIEAIDSYQNFARLYPTHEKVPYATLRIGLSYYKQIPGDWFILPPSEEKEQSAVRDAERALREYVGRYPKDEGIAEGRKTLLEVRKKLLAHERYVAGFYKRIDKDRAYAGRLETIRRDFPDVGLDDELLFELTRTWSKVGEVDRARSALKQLESTFPGSPHVVEARQLVAAAEAQVAPAKPATPEVIPPSDAESKDKDKG